MIFLSRLRYLHIMLLSLLELIALNLNLIQDYIRRLFVSFALLDSSYTNCDLMAHESGTVLTRFFDIFSIEWSIEQTLERFNNRRALFNFKLTLQESPV